MMIIIIINIIIKQLVSRHNVNRTKKSYRRIAGTDKPRDLYRVSIE